MADTCLKLLAAILLFLVLSRKLRRRTHEREYFPKTPALVSTTSGGAVSPFDVQLLYSWVQSSLDKEAAKYTEGKDAQGVVLSDVPKQGHDDHAEEHDG